MHGQRQPFRIMFKSGQPFCFAGLWERWIKPPSTENFDTDLDETPPSETIDSFTIITKPANATIAPLHDRMPVIVKDEHCERWLYDNDPRSEIFTWALEPPSEDPLKIYPVSPMINNAKVDDPLCVQPYRIS
jgi:putative SOS response-associated peptidase YedK